MLWTDKKLFTVQVIHHHQNDWMKAVNKEDILLNEQIAHKHQKPASVIVWAGVTSTGEKNSPIFIEEGVKMNQNIYLNMLKEQLVSWINATFKESGMTIQQDGATSRAANLVQEWGNKKIEDLWTKEIWPPSSSDLNPMDFAA